MARGRKIILLTLSAFLAGAIVSSIGAFLYIRSSLNLGDAAAPDFHVPGLETPDHDDGGSYDVGSDEGLVRRYRAGLNRLIDNLLNDQRFRGSSNPFEEMERMHRQMVQGAGGAERLGRAEVPVEISRREDERYVYFDVNAADYVRDSLKVTVKGETVTISGKISRGPTGRPGRKEETLASSFSKSFPVPLGVEREGLEMTPVDGRVVIQFPRIR